ncbi:MAG: hypothetical protein CSB33_04860 [Desulfobacterales bacterium]|nr:MAG: hypothetical protein CSB33_04860 [Desulfobacterales bacterium]
MTDLSSRRPYADPEARREPVRPGSSGRPPAIRRPGPFLRIIICLLILLLTGIAVHEIIRNRPRPQRKPPQPLSVLVRVQTVHSDAERVVIRAMGNVIPARRITLSNRVAGDIAWRHPDFEAGGRLPAGVEAVKIDPVDYELVLARREADLVTARAALQTEAGRQAVAEREWRVMGMDAKASAREKELALRKPQYRQAAAAVKAAAAEVRRAQLDLARTSIRLPFNALILETAVDTGSRVAASSPLAEIVCTDEYDVRVFLPPDQLGWFSPGATACVRPMDRDKDPSARRTGTVKRVQGDLGGNGRMARVLISMADPLSLDTDGEKRALLLDDYVRVEIQGRRLPGAFRIPRAALRQGDRVWLADAENRLVIRPVQVAWRTPDSVIVDQGLADGDRLIISDIGTPVEGLPLNVENEAPEPKEAAPGGPDAAARKHGAGAPPETRGTSPGVREETP